MGLAAAVGALGDAEGDVCARTCFLCELRDRLLDLLPFLDRWLVLDHPYTPQRKIAHSMPAHRLSRIVSMECILSFGVSHQRQERK